VNNLYVLLVGRGFAGVGTALLYSTFDAWYKFEHEARRFPKEWVSSTFSKQAFGDSILAILSGLVASFATEYIGDIAAFDAALLCLVASGVCIVYTWNENDIFEPGGGRKSKKSDEAAMVMSPKSGVMRRKHITMTDV